jgi:hypothetical protein
MSNYFRQLPNLDYPSLLNDRVSSDDTVRVKNLFRRVKIRDDYFSNFLSHTKYNILGDERPDNVAEKLYGSPDLDWVVLLANNIIDIKNDWPMTQYDLNTYLTKKYTEDELVKVHHYETTEFRDLNNRLIVPAGKVVDENFSIQYLKGSQVVTETPVKSVSYFEWELQRNDDKRTINIIKEEYVGTIVEEFQEITRYDRSSQYVNERLKRAENIRNI